MLDLHYSEMIPMMKETGAMQFDIQSSDFVFTTPYPARALIQLMRAAAQRLTVGPRASSKISFGGENE